MDEDRAPRRTYITITVSEVSAETGKRRERYTVSAGYDRDAHFPDPSPALWPPCACPRSKSRPCPADAPLHGDA
jgi:hypothetical protein